MFLFDTERQLVEHFDTVFRIRNSAGLGSIAGISSTQVGLGEHEHPLHTSDKASAEF